MNLTSFKIKSSEPLFYRFMNYQWKYDDCPHEKLGRKNAAIMKTLFQATMNGKIKGFYLKSDTDFKAYHRSTRENNAIQLSSGFYRDGELFPCYDVQMHSYEDMEKEGYSSGIWEVIQ